jgi:Domain of unknown function (DUF5615)
MRFLANENFPGAAVAELRPAGSDVVWSLTDSPGASDQDVLAHATADGRILLTFDKDFGELAWLHGLPAHCGIILFRIPMPSAATVGQRLLEHLHLRTDWENHFSVIEPGRVRMRPLARPS